MKISDLLESESDQIAEIAIQQRIKVLKQYSRMFDNLVQAHGYEATCLKIKTVIEQSKSKDWMLEGSSTTNPKLEKSYNALLAIRQELLNRIQSGI